MFHALYGLDVVVLRVFMVYGPGQKDLRKLVPYVIQSLLRGETPKMSSGLRPVDWIYVDDVVDAFVAAAARNAGGGEVLEVGSGQLVTVRDLVEQVAPLVRPDAQLRFDSGNDRPMEQVRRAQIQRTTEVLDWHPRVPLAEGLQAHGRLLPRLGGPRCQPSGSTLRPLRPTLLPHAPIRQDPPS